MNLKGRLKLIAEKVPVCRCVCDIGTDHAYIPIYLVINKVCKKAIASDIKSGPISKARENIRKHGLEESIETRIGSGLKPIRADECDVIIIAGMGGLLIREILNEDMEKARNATSIILQPMSDIEVVREWLYNNGFDIYDEGLACEGEKIYNVIAARWTGVPRQLDSIYHHIGEKLLENRDPLVEKYLNWRIRILDRIINEIKNTDNDKIEEEYRLHRKELYNLLQRLYVPETLGIRR